MTTTGIDVIKQALRQRAHHGYLALLARDLGLGIVALQDFAYDGSARLAPAALAALTAALWDGRVVYDPDIDLLRPTNNNPPEPLGIRPPTISEMNLQLPKFAGGPPPLYPAPARPKAKAPRPGWAE
jgi:hypothetical protein